MCVLEDGATLSNVILGPGQAEGVHCLGTWYAHPPPPPNKKKQVLTLT